jgi:hypothetical protein
MAADDGVRVQTVAFIWGAIQAKRLDLWENQPA